MQEIEQRAHSLGKMHDSRPGGAAHTDGEVSELDPDTYEKTASDRERRAELLGRAQDHVFWRRVLYFMFVSVTLALLFMPY